MICKYAVCTIVREGGMDMAHTPTTTMRLDPKLKSDALEVLRPMGLNLSSAVDIFLRAVVRKQGIPFEKSLHEDEDKN